MGDFNRSTKEISLDQIAPNVMQAINAYIEKRNLGDILSDVSYCIVSTSEKIKKGLFSGTGPKLLILTAILTNRWLILADQADKEPILVRTMQLRDITVEDYEKSQFYKMIPDTGLNVSGIFTDAPEKGTFFLPLGKDAAGEGFKEAIIKSIQEAKK
jgi:hypothetical protein